jgi:CheY-like chemotaxis protein
MFEPFFTTKPAGKGTGLGLATVYGIVKQSEGYVYVYSEPGRGTSVKIYLPLVNEAVSSPRSQLSAVPLPQGSGTVLLVEDEEGVRKMSHRVLREAGYEVLVARGGDEALEIGRQHPGRIDLLVTDVVMPRMSGRQLADNFVRQRPGLRVLYTSGYTDDAIVHHGVLDEGVNFIEKPFSPAQLVAAVARVLADPPDQPNGSNNGTSNPEPHRS